MIADEGARRDTLASRPIPRVSSRRRSANEYGHHHGYFSRHRAGIGGALPGTGRIGGGHGPRRQRRSGGLAARVWRQTVRGDRRRDRRTCPERGRPHCAGTHPRSRRAGLQRGNQSRARGPDRDRRRPLGRPSERHPRRQRGRRAAYRPRFPPPARRRRWRQDRRHLLRCREHRRHCQWRHDFLLRLQGGAQHAVPPALVPAGRRMAP